jgi:hypothetical protein
VRSLEGLQILDHTPGCVKTSAVVLRFYQALEAGQEYRDDMWRLWQSMHACEPPPQDMAEAVMVGGLRADYGGSGSFDAAVAAAAAGGPSGGDWRLPSVLTAPGAVASPSAFGGGGGRRATDICFRCKQPGHWGSECPLFGNGGGSQQQHQQQHDAAAGDRKRPAPGVPQPQQQQQQQPAKRSRATRQGRNSAAVAAMPSSKASAIAAFFKPRSQKGAPAASSQPAAGGGGGGGAGKGSCFRCGGTDHWASACPNR